MKTRYIKIIALLLVCSLAFSLTGCDSRDYRKAVGLYNQGQFDAAAEIFANLGDYEDSAALSTLSHYWAAITLAEEGKYAEALPRFLKLGGYEDSAQRAVECTYQMAVAEFDAGNYTDARVHFEEVADYKQSSEYLRRITWQAFFEELKAAGSQSDDGFTLQTEQDGKLFRITANPADPDQLLLFVSKTINAGYSFYDDLQLTLTRDSIQAQFAATSVFFMDYNDSQIGAKQDASGQVDITACTADTVLSIDTFKKTVIDNQGNTTHFDDPAESLMDDTMTENLSDLLAVIPTLLLDAGMELTLNDIGFSAL